MSSDIILPTQSLEYFFIVWMAKADKQKSTSLKRFQMSSISKSQMKKLKAIAMLKIWLRHNNFAVSEFRSVILY